MAAETPEVVATGQSDSHLGIASLTEDSSITRVEVTADTPEVAEDITEKPTKGPVTPPASKTASRSKKRKSEEAADSSAETPLKKTKKETKGPATKPRQTRRSNNATAEDALPPAPSPAHVTVPVQAKIDAVKMFIKTEKAHEDSELTRDPENAQLITIPAWNLPGVIMTLYSHYQLGSPEAEASVADVEEAIVRRFKKPLLIAGDVDWVTVHIATPTTLERRIKEEIMHHGLEDVSLLEVEMEVCARRNRARSKIYEWEADRVITEKGGLTQQIQKLGWEETHRRLEAAPMNVGPEKEIDKKGVCPAPAIELG